MLAYALCLYICALVLPVAYLSYRRVYHRARPSTDNPPPKADKPLKPIMQAPRSDLPPPKDDPFTVEELRQYDGSDPDKPIYVAIKGLSLSNVMAFRQR